jgi:tetratricopeptide (TPR) repeat protein
LNKKSAAGFCAIFLALFAAYLHTLNPAFRADDSPETIASCVTLGIQHPPAYPLETLVGRLASLPPLGSPAWRLNLMAALFGALTATLAAAIVALWSESFGAGALAAVCLGLSPTFWSQCLAAKGGIYTFHTSLLAMLILCLSLWAKDIAPRLERSQSSRLRLLQSRYFLLSALLLFLGFGNHWETQALFVPAALAWLFFLMRGAKIDATLGSGRGLYAPLFKAALLGMAAASVYLLLPLRAALHPAMNWGVPDTWRQFVWVVFRQEYLDIEVGFVKALKSALLGGGNWAAVAENWGTVQAQGIRVITHLMFPSDLGWPLSALALLGAWAMFKARQFKELAFCLTLIAAFSFVVTFYFQLKPEMIWIMDVFLLPAYLVQALLAGMGGAWIAKKSGRELALLAAAALFPALIWMRAGALSQHDHFWAWDYGENFLMSMKKDALVFAEGDFNTMPIYYLQHVKGERLDLAHITTIFISTEWGVNELKLQHPELGVSVIPHVNPDLKVGDGALLKSVMSEIISKNSGLRPIQASLFRQVQSENLPAAEDFMSPSGLSAEFKAPETAAQWLRRMNLPKAMVLRYLPDEQSRLDPSPAFALSNYATMYMDLANYARTHGHVTEAMPLYARAVSVSTPPNRAEAYTHWGIALAAQGQPQQAMEKFQDALAVKPLFEAFANLAGVLNQMKRYAEAEPYARQAISMQPGSAQSWNNLAISLYYSGKKDQAIESLQTAAGLNPQDAAIQANLRALKGGT